jgi:membrane-bound lytic murein transglycosylase D
MLKKILLGLLFVLLAGTSGWLFIQSPQNTTLVMQRTIVNEQNYRIISFDLPMELHFADVRIPLELFYTRESLERELLVNTYWHSSTLLLLKRANRWFPVIEPILAAHHVPDDFKFLAMIESNLTNARSPAGAVGFWQFLEGTAKDYKLEISRDVDERYHVELATAAACRYLLNAYNRFGDWALVAAAYNAGNRRISDFLNEQMANSYFDLLMAEETERYLFRILAMKIIFQNPEKFGFYPEIEKLYPPLAYEGVVIDQSIDNLAVFSKQQGISYKLLKHYNPWLRTNKLAVSRGKTYLVKLPVEPFNLTHEKLEKLYERSSE